MKISDTDAGRGIFPGGIFLGVEWGQVSGVGGGADFLRGQISGGRFTRIGGGGGQISRGGADWGGGTFPGERFPGWGADFLES